MRQRWDEGALDSIIVKGLTRSTTVTCNTHSNASKLRYALINRLRRQRKGGIDYRGADLTITVKDNTVTVSVRGGNELVILSVGETVDGNEEHEGRRTSPSVTVSSQGSGGEP